MITEGVDQALRQAQLLDLLACPRCRASLCIDDAVTRSDGVSAADLVCKVHGRVGVVDRHRPSFLDREIDALPLGSAATRTTETTAPVEYVSTSGRWWPIAEGWAGAAEPGVAMIVDGSLAAVSFEALRDEWSPVVELLVGGEVVQREDLSNVDSARPLSCSFGSCEVRHIELRVAGSVPSGRLVVTDTSVRLGSFECAASEWGPVDRGNPYPQGFVDLLDSAPDECVALDCGGGDRRLGDPRLFNLEYLPYDAPDLYGDGLALPFSDGSFDLILSQAVLEHVPDPQLAVDEMGRILKPGGRIYCEMAFTQPLHAVPSHYFNITPHGAAHLFRDWHVEVLDWFGGVAVTVDWWMRILGLGSRWDEAKTSKLKELLGEVDSLTDHQQLRHFASGVLVVATCSA